jgi:HprK-related kinase A
VKLAELSDAELQGRLKQGALAWRAGPFVLRARSSIEAFAQAARLTYGDFTLEPEETFADFALELAPGRGFRNPWRAEVSLWFGGRRPFLPLPRRQAYPFFEWGLNWCVASHVQDWLLIHAAVVERRGRAVVMVGPPGSGKSTLCAALLHRGWRLFSDEFAMIDLEGGALWPWPRPVSLKNRSIELIAERCGGMASLTTPVADTSKGLVAHLKPPTDSVRRMAEPARPGLVLFPTFTAGAPLRLVRRDMGTAFLALAEQSFNYSLLGEQGFHSVARLLAEAPAYDLSHDSLDEAIDGLQDLVDSRAALPC